ncbi:hypothetical protein [Photobacterium sp.]|uniref:hypothetical protein n=1 Tax=Photobacterium sp. TaxID=660 RepID=UPI00299E310E|nr:hypothetical protein [Photobacterium sp.]MDX1301184.1 hypothetical protein [Photobacterium sp.]
MAWETGTANGYRDLLAKLKVFAQQNGWTVKRWQPRTVDTAFDELILESVDAVSKERFIAAFKTDEEPTDARFNWKLYCAPAYFEALTFEQMPDKNPYHYMYLWDQPLTYYFITDADHRHLKVVAQISTTTHVIYMGRVNMFASIAHWPDQYGCFGEGTASSFKWNTQSDGVSTFQFARNDARHIHWLDKSWLSVEYTWPYQPNYYYGLSLNLQTNYLNDDHWMMPIYPCSKIHRCLGAFIGAYQMSGPNTSTGQVINTTDNLRSYLVVQNIYRTGDSDFMCLELD